MRKILISLFVFLLMSLLSFSYQVRAQQTPQNRKWVTQNPKYVEFSSAGMRFLPHDPKEGSNSVTTALHLPIGRPWRIAFDVQMVPTTGGGMSVHLAQGTTELCWLGAGDYYKYISGFLGSGNSNMPFNQPWDNNWHSFMYASDGKTLSLWHNGSKCGETPLVGTPDNISIQSIGMELRVRNVSVASSPIPQSKSNIETSTVPVKNVQVVPVAVREEKDTNTATLTQTLDWISKTLPVFGKTVNSKGYEEFSYISCDFNLSAMTLNCQDRDEFADGLVFDTTHVIPLKNMDSSQVVVTTQDKHPDLWLTFYDVHVDTTDNKESLSDVQYSFYDGSKLVSHRKDAHFLFIDKEIAERFAKALRHAIRLSKTYKSNEPF